MVVEATAGGTGRHVIDLTRAMSTRGHDVTLIYSPDRADACFRSALTDLPARVVEMPMARAVGWRDVGAAVRLTKLVRSHGPFAVVHAHSSKAGAIARLAAVGGAARVYTPHALATLDPDRGAVARWLIGLAERLLARTRTDGLILVSEAEHREAARLGVPSKLRHLIANQLIDYDPRLAEVARTALGANEGDQWIGFVGRLSPQKAPLQFVAAALGAMRRNPRVRALIVGDGELALMVEEAVSASDFAHRFTWLRDAAAGEWIAALDLLVVTSRYEGLSYVLLEALVAGVPVLSTPVGGADELLGEGAGLVCRPEAMPAALLALLADGPRLAAMRLAAKRAGAQCQSERMIDQTEALYSRLAGVA